MKSAVNPFRQLYVGESVGPEEFVRLFSPVLVSNSLALFQPGNVILKGFTGAGKSMLLNLLLPETRIAYEKLGERFPIPKQFSKFIGAGINLQTSGVSHFGNRVIKESPDLQTNESPFFFGDFLNYYVVADLLGSINKLSQNQVICKEIGIDMQEDKLQRFIELIRNNDCWFGYLSNVNDFKSLYHALTNRIVTYKNFLNINLRELPNDIKSTKTIVGEPISVAANLLKESGIIKNDVQIFIRIDQYEELTWLGAKDGIGGLYQEIIHKLLGIRDSSVSYRIGTRHFAWAEEKTMFGTTARLEKKRNYLEFHLEDEMRRKENARTWLFPKLAEDIFKRRILNSGYDKTETQRDFIKKVFGRKKSPRETALMYFVGEKKDKAVEFEKSWPGKWKKFLEKLANSDPFEARLAEAWSRQRGKENIVNKIPVKKPFPWDKQYWKKERTEQGLMQLASRNQQQLHWSGKEDILALSGGNILALLSLCQHIWDVWLRDNRYENRKSIYDLPIFDSIIQSIGIIEASNDWYNELANDERGGRNRKKFVTLLGTIFFKTLIEDKSMSNPGHNGFSVDLADLSNSDYNSFLKDCSDYGDLYDSPHTSKLKDKKKRWKFYLNPILSPYFKIPYVHTKEPMYITIEKLDEWFYVADVPISRDENFKLSFKKHKTVTRKKSETNSTNLKFDF
jgi:hypothetical protein